MKKLNYVSRILALAFLGLFLLTDGIAQGLQPDIQYFRYRDQRGINVFEVDKTDTIPYDGLKIRLGANFWQSYQALSHENTFGSDTSNGLYTLGNGFNLATANLNLDVQLEDGLRVAVETYMSSRHHPEFWVKGGYLQVDKLSWLAEGSFVDFWNKHLRFKAGHFEVNYGDQHFRRSDNANDAYNPFMEGYILDAFATEIGGEMYYFTDPGLFFMLGVTSGLIKGDINDYSTAPAGNGAESVSPSILAKIGYDKQMNDDLRLRFTGSYYGNGGSPRNTLYAGDRAGSHYYGVMEEADFNATGDFTSGRLNRNNFNSFSHNVSAIMVNAFVKWKGLEFFGTYETASGKSASEEMNSDNELTEDNRTVNQIAAEVVYRFLEREQLFVGARYNTVSGEFFAKGADDFTVNRLSVAAGWWPTKNILTKIEYVDQTYSGDGWGSSRANLFDEGKFSGVMFTGAVHF